MSNPNGDTPDQNKDQKPAGTGTDTPPNNGASPDPVEELKNQVEREKARAATALQEKDAAEKRARDEKIARIRAEKALKAAGGNAGGANGNDNPSGSSVNEDTEAEQVRLESEKGIFVLVASNPQYQELLGKDPTLKEVLLKNPLSLISEYIDSEDAVDQIKKYLETRLQATAPNPSTPPSDGKDKKDVPPPGSQKIEVKGSITPEQARSMSTAEWAKLPKEQRMKMLQGEF